jgi:multidrug efflux pump subunit AcrA (membrane-fusion protein)
MREFWVSSGHHLTQRAAHGGLIATPELIMAYLARPELAPPEEACDAERALHAALLLDPLRAVSADERDRARFAADRARATAALRAAEVRQLETDLARLTVRAPLAGQILRVNVRPGEYAPAGPTSEPLMAMGDVTPLHVRVQIDEEDASRIREGAPAEAALRGDGARRIALRFVRFEPQAVPKRNLNGGAERIDTRVMEAIYAFDPKDLRAVVGQQMDVFVDAAPLPRLAKSSEAGAQQ